MDPAPTQRTSGIRRTSTASDKVNYSTPVDPSVNSRSRNKRPAKLIDSEGKTLAKRDQNNGNPDTCSDSPASGGSQCKLSEEIKLNVEEERNLMDTINRLRRQMAAQEAQLKQLFCFIDFIDFIQSQFNEEEASSKE